MEEKEQINVTLKKGDKDIIKNHARFMKERVGAFIRRAIYETIERDEENEWRERHIKEEEEWKRNWKLWRPKFDDSKK